MDKGGLLEHFLKTYAGVLDVGEEITDSCKLFSKSLTGVSIVLGIVFVLCILGFVLLSMLVVLIGVITPFINLTLISKEILGAGLCGNIFAVILIFTHLVSMLKSDITVRSSNTSSFLYHLKERFINKFCTKIEWKDR